MPAPFRADHVGSLLRPQELHELREQVRRGKADAASLKAAEDRLIREVVKLQEDLGLPSITDGEFRRDWWHIDFLAGFDGVALRQEEDPYHGIQFRGTEAKPPTLHVTEPTPRVDWTSGAVRPVTEPIEWPRTDDAPQSPRTRARAPAAAARQDARSRGARLSRLEMQRRRRSREGRRASPAEVS